MRIDKIIPFMFLLSMTACSSYLPSQPRFNASVLLPKSHQIAADGRVTDVQVVASAEYNNTVKTPVPISCEAADSGNATRADRDRCIRDLEADIELAFHEYEIQLQSDIAKTNTFLDVGGIALSTASTAVGGATAKTILSAIGTGVGGLKASISDDYLYKSTMQTLHSQMIADRAKVAARIDDAMKGDVAVYDMHSAYRDLIEYYYAGTLLGALQSVNADAGAKAVQCTAAAQGAKATTEGAAAAPAAPPGVTAATSTTGGCNIVTYTYNYGESGASLQKIWKPDGKTFDKKAEGKLKTCLTKLGISGTITALVYGRSDADKNRVLGCYAAS